MRFCTKEKEAKIQKRGIKMEEQKHVWLTNQRKAILAIIAVLLIIAIITGIYPYFTSIKNAENVFTIGNIDINLTEGDAWDNVASGVAPDIAQNIQPGQAIDKAPVVQNVGANPAYVYLKVYVPVNNYQDLFTYEINETEGQDIGWTKRDEDMHTTIDGQVYNIYTYEYDEILEPGTETSALFDEVVFAEGMSFTPDEVTALGTTKNIIIKAYGIQAEAGVDQATNEITEQMTGDANEEDGLVKVVSGTPVSDITVANYGQYINIGTDILEYGTDSTTQADWRVFHKTNDGVWLILDDYLPNNKIPSGIVLQTGGTTHAAFDFPTEDGDEGKEILLSKLQSDWSDLITGSSVKGQANVVVIGGVSYPIWLESWNVKHGTNYSATGDETTGYSDYITGLDNSEKLYFPHSSVYGGAYSYWLTSRHRTYALLMAIGCSGKVSSGSYRPNGPMDYLAVRPAIYLPNRVLLNTTGDVWTIAQ
jgi:hypothetical protein